MVDMEPYTYKKLEKRVGRPTKGKKCDRCGRDGHTRSQCYATTTADKVAITTKTWKYRPKAKPKPKPKPKPKAKPKPKSKAVTCGRCGHTGHNRTSCFTGTTVDGVKITTKTWKYRPKAKAKRKAKKKRI